MKRHQLHPQGSFSLYLLTRKCETELRANARRFAQVAKHPHDTYRSLAESNRWRKQRREEEEAYSEAGRTPSHASFGGASSRLPGSSVRSLNERMLTCCQIFSTDAASRSKR